MKSSSFKMQRVCKGFGLVDTMVGMVIALIGMVIIFQVFSISEGVKRTTTSGSDAQQTGAISLVYLERSLKMAGYGIFVNNVPPIPNDFLATTYPVTITFGANAMTSDSIAIVSRRSWDFGSFYDPANMPTIVPPAPTTETISISNVNTKLQLISATTMATAIPPPYTVAAAITPATTDVIADGVVLLKAQYGVDGAGGNPIDGVLQPGEWTLTAPALPWGVNGVGGLIAIRLVVVTRSANPEKPSVLGGPCDTTTVAPAWSGSVSLAGSAASLLDLSGQADLLAAGDDWKCYRYKTYETTVPLRNVLWHL